MEAGKHGQSFGPLKLPRLTQEAKVHLGRFTSPGCGKGQGMKQAREKEEGGGERNINVAPRPKGSLRSGETIPRQDLLTRRFGICSQLSIRSSGWIEKLGKKYVSHEMLLRSSSRTPGFFFFVIFVIRLTEISIQPNPEWFDRFGEFRSKAKRVSSTLSFGLSGVQWPATPSEMRMWARFNLS